MSKTPSKLTRVVSTLRPFASQMTLTPNATSFLEQPLVSTAQAISQ